MIRVTLLCIILLILTSLFITCQQPSEKDGNSPSDPNDKPLLSNEVTDSLVILLFKKERVLEFWNWSNDKPAQQSAKLAFKGSPLASGPRLSDQALELPEGVYSFVSSGQLAFPNAFDRRKATADKRTFKKNTLELKDYKDLYPPISDAVKSIGSSKSSIIIVPVDFRKSSTSPMCSHCPPWTNELYNNLRMTLEDYSSK